MKQIEALLFDFGGTLDNDGLDWFARMHRLAQQDGETLDEATFRTHASEAGNYLAAMDESRGWLMDELVTRFIHRVHENVSAGNGRARWQPGAVAERFVAEARGMLERNEKVLAKLKQNYRLGCISNNWGNTAGWCHQFSLDQHFEVMIDSTLVGASKPDRRIFQAALEGLDLPGAACAYVGDWFSSDMVGAREAGFTTVWVQGGLSACTDPSVVDHRIDTLADIEQLDL